VSEDLDCRGQEWEEFWCSFVKNFEYDMLPKGFVGRI
jgi:hypothetical protein